MIYILLDLIIFWLLVLFISHFRKALHSFIASTFLVRKASAVWVIYDLLAAFACIWATGTITLSKRFLYIRAVIEATDFNFATVSLIFVGWAPFTIRGGYYSKLNVYFLLWWPLDTYKYLPFMFIHISIGSQNTGP